MTSAYRSSTACHSSPTRRRRWPRSAGRGRRAGCAERPSSRSSPSRIRRTTTAHSSRSARNFGKIRPRLTSPTLCPARPIRCSPRATDFGDSTWITRSTAPMSIPSSSEEVATRHGSSPAFSSSSTTVRSSRASEPWWARAISRWAVRRRRPRLRELVQPQRQALGGAAVVDEDDRRAVLADELRARDRSPARSSAASPRCRPASGSSSGRRRVVGLDHRVDRHLDPEVQLLAHAGVDDRQLRRGPTMNLATSSSGFWVALRPMRCGSGRRPRASGARVSAPDASRAWSRRPRGSRRRCTSGRLEQGSRRRPVSIR